MKTRKIKLTAIYLILTLSLLIRAFAQTGGEFEIKPSVIANGGGASSGGAFSVVSTIGEPLAGTNSTGGNFSLISGFWAASAISSAPRRAPFDFDGDGQNRRFDLSFRARRMVASTKR